MTQLYGLPLLADLNATNCAVVEAYINGSGLIGLFHAVKISNANWYYAFCNDSTPGGWVNGHITT
jgi:sugar phosphate permease